MLFFVCFSCMMNLDETNRSLLPSSQMTQVFSQLQVQLSISVILGDDHRLEPLAFPSFDMLSRTT